MTTTATIATPARARERVALAREDMNRRLIAVLVAVLATGLIAACDVLVLLHHQHHWPHGFPVWLEGTLSLPIWLAIGLLVTFRVPGNVLGPIALGYAVLDGLQLSTGALATYLAGAHASTPAVNWIAGASVLAQSALVAGLIVFAQLAPDGRLVSRRWWPFTAATIAAALISAVASLGSAADMHDTVSVAHVVVPGMSDALLHVLFVISITLIVIGLGGALAGGAVRWRRGDRLQRQQLKLVLYAVATAVGLAAVVQPIGNVLFPDAKLVGSIMWTIIPSVLPASIAAAILRYRLYDIDRILSRTVSYAVVTGGVVGVYIGVVALIESVLGFSSSVAVAASTLAAAATFQPLRRRVQRVIDRRFNRTAYDSRRTVDAFSSRLRDEVDVDTVTIDLVTTATSAVSPASASVWLVHT